MLPCHTRSATQSDARQGKRLEACPLPLPCTGPCTPLRTARRRRVVFFENVLTLAQAAGHVCTREFHIAQLRAVAANTQTRQVLVVVVVIVRQGCTRRRGHRRGRLLKGGRGRRPRFLLQRLGRSRLGLALGRIRGFCQRITGCFLMIGRRRPSRPLCQFAAGRGRMQRRAL